MSKVHVVVGGSNAGKTSFVQNVFIKGSKVKEYKDKIVISETDKYKLIGPYDMAERTKGTDRIARNHIPLIAKQVINLCKSGNKDVVVEGDKITSYKFLDELYENNIEVVLYWIKCSNKESIRRNRVNGSTSKDSHLKAVNSKARNVFNSYKNLYESYIVSSEEVEDFSKFNMSYAVRVQKEVGEVRSNFVVFILSHGRADNVKTLKTLKKANYTGDWYIVIDNEDKTADEYYKNFGEDHVIMFDKKKKAEEFDGADNFDDRRTIVYARNACFDIAEELGYKYFLELDDDYTSLGHRLVRDEKFIEVHSQQANKLFEAMLQFLDDTNASTVALAQGGDFIGGAQSSFYRKGISRKAMNTFFCDVDKRFDFVGRVNEDVNTYTYHGSIGKLLFTVTKASITQATTQTSEGGMTDIYLASGTYIKSFYTVMFMPSSVKVTMMGDKHRRLHHQVRWNNTVPKILDEKHKKK